MVNLEDRKKVFAEEKQKNEIIEFCSKPISSNEDVLKWQKLFAEAAKDLSVKLDNGQTVPKALAAKKMNIPFKDAIKMNKSGSDQAESTFQALLKNANPKQIDAMEKELEKAGIDTKNMAFLGAGNNSTVLMGKNKDGKYIAVKPTFNRDEATPSELGNYNFKPEHACVIGVDGKSQAKMDKKDGSIGLAVNPIAIPLEKITEHLAKKYNIADDIMKAREVDIENVICKTSSHAYADLGQTRENMGVIPDAHEGEKGRLFAIDTGAFRPWGDLMKEGQLTKKGNMIKEIMAEKAEKVPNIEVGFGDNVKPEKSVNSNIMATIKSKVQGR